MDLSISGLSGAPSLEARPDSTQQLLNVARDLEATFLAEMLKHAGVGDSPDTFGGGVGEEQFSSFLREAQAREIVANGGIGLAEAIFNSLKESSDAQ